MLPLSISDSQISERPNRDNLMKGHLLLFSLGLLSDQSLLSPVLYACTLSCKAIFFLSLSLSLSLFFYILMISILTRRNSKDVYLSVYTTLGRRNRYIGYETHFTEKDKLNPIKSPMLENTKNSLDDV
jgi:hypothetical protein